MFKQFEEPSMLAQLNKSTNRAVIKKFTDSSAIMHDIIEDVLPKKSSFYSGRLKAGEYKIDLYAHNNEILFFQREKDDKVYPSLKLLHKYPDLLPQMQIDKGGLSHIFGGANVMCRGLTSPGAKMDDVPANSVVAIYVEGQEHALAVGFTKLSTEQIKKVNSGIAIETMHYLNDGLWQLKELKQK